eukprot:TRINITY_DN15953_c0_g1_i1.p1 TRINITY_DN15953_c0_g1~~TRINITY_DN15953_c0_g1_i1.p1  ORF type:complete len:260 (-),score=38.83 TRINITY_DN15953_c0_g1_i1:82-861(-)
MSVGPQVIIITGASSGIGEAMAYRYASSRMCRLVLAARSVEKLNQIANKCRKLGVEVAVVQTDVGKPEQCKKLITETLRIFKQIDMLVLNAGVSMHILFEELEDLSIFHKLMDINYFGYVYCTHYALPHLRNSPDPQIVVVASLSGETGVPLRTGYCASKFAVNGFFHSLQTEIGDELPITIVSPGYVDTDIRSHSFGPDDFKPNSKMMTSDRCAELIIDAADKRKKKVVLTLSGKLAYILRPVMPGLLDNIVKKKSVW